MAKTKSFEQDLKSLEKIVEKLEAGNVSLDEALDLFQKGRHLTRQCEGRLKEVELKIQELLEEEEGDLSTVNFESDEAEDSADESSDESDASGE
ncbi:exodeoxyribonuclease VII small subunit [Candidatus Sumerlaeota bacterium]|nr:exodeoxyribonuclease VII small subunit [Candidatus Sumerlaeota bacterium]